MDSTAAIDEQPTVLSRAEELHLRALPEPYVNLSIHSASRALAVVHRVGWVGVNEHPEATRFARSASASCSAAAGGALRRKTSIGCCFAAVDGTMHGAPEIARAYETRINRCL
jgi:hypothetical protein